MKLLTLSSVVLSASLLTGCANLPTGAEAGNMFSADCHARPLVCAQNNVSVQRRIQNNRTRYHFIKTPHGTYSIKTRGNNSRISGPGIR